MSYEARNIAFSGPSYTVHFGRNEYAFQKVSYGDKLDGVEFLTSLGSQEQTAQTAGIYKTEPATVQQLRAEWDRMIKAMIAQHGSNGLGNVIFPVTIAGLDPGLPNSIVKLIDCRIIGAKEEIEATGKASMVEFQMSVRQITRNGVSLNARRNAPRPQGGGGGSAGGGETVAGISINISF